MNIYNNLEKVLQLIDFAYKNKNLLINIDINNKMNLIIRYQIGFIEHECLIPLIQKELDINEKFSFHWGQAQKWVNMTLKYLRLMGVRFDSIEAEMHIPIDSYIIEAAAESSDDDLVEGIAVKGLGIKLDWDKTWSRCDDKGKYSTFQGAVREKTDNKQLEWEEKAWMAMAIRHAAEGR